MAEKTNDVSLKETLLFHWHHALKYPKQVAVSFIAGPLSVVGSRYIGPIFIAALLTAIQSNTVTIQNSIWLIIGYGITQIVAFVIGYRINLFAMWSVQMHGVRDINLEAYEALSRHSLQFHNDRFAGSLVSQVNKTSSSFMAFWNMIINQIMFVVVSIIATLIGVSFISFPLTIILAIFVTIFIIVAYYRTRFMRPRQLARSKAQSKVSGQLSDSISNMVAVKIESKEKVEYKRLSAYLDDVIVKEKYARAGVIFTSSIFSSMLVLARIATLVVAVIAVQSHAINAGSIYLLITYTFNLLEEIWNVNDALRITYQISGDSSEMLAVIKEPIDISDRTNKKLIATKGVVALNNITFSHEVGETLFENLNLIIPAGQKIGVVGMSGSGKTSLTKLLLRLNDPQSGSITIDDQDIANVTQASLHDAVAYVTQEPLLFHRSLKENIAYSRPKATEAEIEQAAKDAQAFEFIQKLEEGFETLVGERGVKLSGGQRQRVAIARAILKQAPVLILDEATSALDSQSEQLIQTALEKLMESRTSIVIAHRLSTIANLDRIIVMDNGKIIEDGNHKELLARNGMYANLWTRQSGGFIEE